MNSPVPDYLESTWAMVVGAYPDGVPPDDYLALIEVLLERLSFHNATSVLDALSPEERGHYNDVSKVAGDPAAVEEANRVRVRQHLRDHGLEHWLREPD